jgi:hypothetical protein
VGRQAAARRPLLRRYFNSFTGCDQYAPLGRSDVTYCYSCRCRDLPRLTDVIKAGVWTLTRPCSIQQTSAARRDRAKFHCYDGRRTARTQPSSLVLNI